MCVFRETNGVLEMLQSPIVGADGTLDAGKRYSLIFGYHALQESGECDELLEEERKP